MLAFGVHLTELPRHDADEISVGDDVRHREEVGHLNRYLALWRRVDAIVMRRLGSVQIGVGAEVVPADDKLMQVRTKLQMRNINSARERIRQYLAVNAGADGATVSLTGTLKELAADIGLTHEALYRVLAEMAADGEIRRSEGRILRILSYDPDHMG